MRKRPMTSAFVRAVMASRSPTRRLATAVASPTVTTATVPIKANWMTGPATVHRLDERN